jgi:integrase/recombinase XerD
MLTIYRRHLATCKFKGRKHRKCNCPIWAAGVLHGRKIKKSLDLRSWEAAQKLVQDMEIKGEHEAISVRKAGERFISARRVKGNTEETLKKLERLTKIMTEFFGDIPIDRVTFDDAARFYESWKLGPLTRGKQLERMRSFFNFCVRRKWIADNPCLGIEKPAIVEIERKPFEADELEKIAWAVEIFPIKGIYKQHNRERLKAFIAVLRWTGLRIRDVVQLKRLQVQGDYIILRTQKNKKQVKLIMHVEVKEALASMPRTSNYFFWSGEGNPKSCVGDWQRTFLRLSKIAGLRVHAHRFRHNFAADLLSKGVSITDVAAILGNSARIVEKHYAQFVKQRQDALDRAVQATFS